MLITFIVNRAGVGRLSELLVDTKLTLPSHIEVQDVQRRVIAESVTLQFHLSGPIANIFGTHIEWATLSTRHSPPRTINLARVFCHR